MPGGASGQPTTVNPREMQRLGSRSVAFIIQVLSVRKFPFPELTRIRKLAFRPNGRREERRVGLSTKLHRKVPAATGRRRSPSPCVMTIEESMLSMTASFGSHLAKTRMFRVN
jgi:hypothetical protein